MEILRNDAFESSYTIGVLRKNRFSSYLLSVTLEDNILALESGVAVVEQVSKFKQRHFSFTPPLNLQVKIQLSVTLGDADLYVSTKWARPTAANRFGFFSFPLVSSLL